MDNTFHYLLMANQALFHKKLLLDLKDTGLTLGQPKVLDYLRDHNGANQKEIAAACHIEAASLTSILNRMEEKQIIERKMLNGNRRSFHIFLTESGEQFKNDVEEAFLRLEEEAFHGFSETEKEEFIKKFEMIFENLVEKE